MRLIAASPPGMPYRLALAGAVKVTAMPGTPTPLASLTIAATGAPNAVFTLVLWLLPELTVIVAGTNAAIVKLSVFWTETAGVAESVTVITTELVPEVNAAPEITPVAAAIDKPVGKPVADQR